MKQNNAPTKQRKPHSDQNRSSSVKTCDMFHRSHLNIALLQGLCQHLLMRGPHGGIPLCHCTGSELPTMRVKSTWIPTSTPASLCWAADTFFLGGGAWVNRCINPSKSLGAPYETLDLIPHHHHSNAAYLKASSSQGLLRSSSTTLPLKQQCLLTFQLPQHSYTGSTMSKWSITLFT